MEQFEERKKDHLRLALDSANQAHGLSGLDALSLVHEALPDLDFSEVVLAGDLSTPFYISGMTAGHANAVELNRRLALACARRGWIFGIGSQRRELEALQCGTSFRGDQWEKLRGEVGDQGRWIANLGISQVISASVENIQELLNQCHASALVIHLNALQEGLQPEGTPHFKGGLEAIARLSRELKTPVMLKETGCGMSRATLQKVSGLGLAAIDISGLGGTHWGRIEGARAGQNPAHQGQFQAAQTFANWGIPTVQSVRWAKEVVLPGTEIWMSGGVRTGLDAAKGFALGAHRIGFARPALEAALQGDLALDQWMAQVEFECRLALWCAGVGSPEGLRQKGEKAWLSR